jgi:hypothetical protein
MESARLTNQEALRCGYLEGMTPRQWFELMERAAQQGPDAYDRLKRQISEETEAGIARGGPPCCGTTGIWHRPWCLEGPWEPETAPRASDV